MNRGIISIFLCAAFLTSAIVLSDANVKANPGGTYYIRDDATGGDCTSIGTWDSSTKTCTMTMDVYETIEIMDEGITLDGDGHSVIWGSGDDGVIAYSVSSVAVKNVHVVGFSHGIFLYDSHGSTLTGNTVTDSLYGILLSYSNGVKLRDNDLTDNGNSLHVAGSMLPNFIQDIDTSNTVDGKPIYYWVDRSGETVPSDAGFVGIINSDDITMQDLTLEGVFFAYTTASLIERVTVSGYHSIYLRLSDGNTVTENVVTSSGYGICLDESDGNTVTGNTVTSSFRGIFLMRSTGNELSGNTVTGDWNCIFLFDSTGNTFTGNTIAYGKYGIYLWLSGGNMFFYNRIVDNVNQLYYDSPNTWDDGYGFGNYWSDYTGEDLDSDGVGDTLLPHQTVDWYPLMEPWNPKYEVKKLIKEVQGMGLQKGAEKSLVNLLKAALKALERDDIDTAIRQLQAFIDLVEAYRGMKLTDAQADYLHAEAQKIIDELSG